MYLVWHIVRKDLYRLRLHLVLWGVTLALSGLAATVVSRFESALPFGVVAGVLFLLSTLLGYVFFVELVTGDPVAQANAFWVTRPISWPRLFAAKIAAGVVGALVVLMLAGLLQQIAEPRNWPGWRVYGFATGTVLAISMLTAFLAAALSRNFRESVLWSCVLCVGAIVAVNVFPISSLDGIGHARRTLLAWIVPLAAGALTAYQFYHLRRLRTLVALGGTIAGIALIAFVWPWSWPRPVLPAAENAEAFSNVGFAFHNAWRYDTPGRGKSLTVSVASSGIPARHWPVHLSSHHTWSWRDSAEPSATSSWLKTPPARRSGLDEIAREALGIPPGAQSQSQPVLSLSLPRLDAATWARLEAETPAYTADLAITLWRAEITGELPLRAGESIEGNRHPFRIAALDMNEEGALVVRVVQYAPLRHALGSRTGADTTVQDPAYFVVNRRSGECLRIAGRSWMSAPFSRETHLALTVDVPEERRPHDKDFLRDADLVQVGFQQVAILRPRLELPEFKLAGSRP